MHTPHDTGGVIILELYPLLHAEGHAVPYEAVTLRKILRDAGYASESAQIAVRQGSVSAYCLLARQQARALDERQLVNAVEKAWKEILSDCLSSYAMKLTPTDLEGYQNLASRLTMIASIVSWSEGTWKRIGKNHVEQMCAMVWLTLTAPTNNQRSASQESFCKNSFFRRTVGMEGSAKEPNRLAAYRIADRRRRMLTNSPE